MTCLSSHATHLLCRWVALSVMAASCAAPIDAAQDTGIVPAVRAEAREVIIPTIVGAHGPRGDYFALHLAARDFHVSEDGKEQEINGAPLAALDITRLQVGNLENPGRTPRGMWRSFPEPADHGLGNHIWPYYYAISYRPPLSTEGSCHKIQIKVDPKDESGRRLTTVDSALNEIGNSAQNVFGNRPDRITAEVDRRSLLLLYRRQYCNVPHFENDPLYGTSVSSKLESLATKETKNRAEEEGFYLSAIEHVDESNAPRVHVALDFRNFSSQTGIQSFEIALLGMFSRANGELAARFSDSNEEGCVLDQSDLYWGLQQSCTPHGFSNHYETEVDLPPGEYDLRVAINFGGALRRAEVPVSIRVPEERLAVSGIALCRHYSLRDLASLRPQSMPVGMDAMPSPMTSLVSKGIEFNPTGDTRFKKKEPLAAYFEVYEALLASGGNAHVQFEMQVVDAKTGEIKSDTGFRPADGYVNTGKAVIPISEKIAIEELSPGEYRLQVRAMDSAGNSTDWRSTSFTRE
jgi:hypothetical protein